MPRNKHKQDTVDAALPEGPRPGSSSAARVTPEHLKLFVTLATEGSLRKVSDTCDIPVNTISNKLDRLNKLLGLTVSETEREGKERVITTAGKRLFPKVLRLLEDFQVVEKAVLECRALERDGVRRTLRVAYVPSLARDLVVPSVIDVQRDYPGLEIQLFQGTTENVVRRVSKGEADVGLGFNEGTYAAGVKAQRLVDRPLSLVMFHENELAREKQVKLDSLNGVSMALLAKEVNAGKAVNDYFERNGVLPVALFQANSISEVLLFVRQTGCMTIIPKPEDMDDHFVAVPLSPDPPSITFDVILPCGGEDAVVLNFVQAITKRASAAASALGA
jgi:DNA-binding transcriptional LysR family regulator